MHTHTRACAHTHIHIEWLRVVSFTFKQWYFQVAKLWNICMAMGEILPHFANRLHIGYWAFTILMVTQFTKTQSNPANQTFQYKAFSSSTLVLDSRDRQGNVWLPYNAAMLAAFTILRCKTSSKTRLVWYVIKAKNLFKTSIYALEVMFLNF